MTRRALERHGAQLELGLVNMSAPPINRAGCPTERPCARYSCSQNNHVDTERAGRPNKGFAPLAKLLPQHVRDRVASCALDVASEGEHSNDFIAKQINTTPRRVQQVVNRALKKVEVALMLEDVLDEHLRPKLPKGARLDTVYPANRDDTGHVHIRLVFSVDSSSVVKR